MSILSVLMLSDHHLAIICSIVVQISYPVVRVPPLAISEFAMFQCFKNLPHNHVCSDIKSSISAKKNSFKLFLDVEKRNKQAVNNLSPFIMCWVSIVSFKSQYQRWIRNWIFAGLLTLLPTFGWIIFSFFANKIKRWEKDTCTPLISSLFG